MKKKNPISVPVVSSPITEEDIWCSKIIEDMPDLKNQVKYIGWKKPDLTPDTEIGVEWETGGVSGGSCWDSSNPRSYTNDEPIPELTALDDILEKICPTISFLPYKKIVAQVINYSNRTENEYYGNSTDYSSKSFTLRKLYQSLKSRNLI